MIQWDYSKVDLNQTLGRTDDIDLLEAAGAQGWELIAVMANNCAYLKRPREDIAPAQEAAPVVRVTRTKRGYRPKES